MSTKTKPEKKKRRREAIPAHHLPVYLRIGNMDEVNLGYISQKEIEEEVDRCISCRKPKCVEACPSGFDIRGVVDNLKEGDFQSAADIVNDFYCIPSSFNRICPAFCQDACLIGKKGDPLQILNIKRYLADNYEKPASFYEREPLTGKMIAIIGSGPAGLTAAYDLAKKGHAVTVFEKLDIMGGMLAVGIPEYRLNNELLHTEIIDLEKFGVVFITDNAFGIDFDHDDLFNRGYNSILLTIGAHKPKFMGIPGEALEGNIHAIQFLKDVAIGKNPQIGKKVMVIGGGDVAIDAVRVANRLGSEAYIVYRRSKEEMPATKEEIHETDNEGIPINFLTNPVEIVGAQGKVSQVKLIKMKLGEPDDSGRRRPEEIEGSEYYVEVDTVIQAISQEPEYKKIKEIGFDLDRWNTFDVGEGHWETNIPGVFAAGDAVSGPRTAIEAMDQARKAAIAIDSYLSDNKSEEEKEILVTR
ncbi:MAG: NAD(P)-dependent oxidoreductase [Candidatus Heimdallarchaeota archaeon]|nr:NAD(P)-dependent oxidoreductase [Candidatus Heimdallarchaeota archaeon]